VDGRKFTTKLISDTKSQNKIHYYTISESEDIIDLTLTENDITEVIEDNNKEYPIIRKIISLQRIKVKQNKFLTI